MSENQTHMTNGKGHLVPVEQVSDYDKVKDKLVRELFDDAVDLSKILAEFKRTTMDNLMAFIELAHEQYGAKVGGNKGNVQIVSFDGRLRVQLTVADCVAFDERLKVAKSLIDECLNSWTENARPEVRTLINKAFEVDKKGDVSPSKVLPLLQLEIKDERWLEAMTAIKDSLTVQYSKQYVRFHQRSGPDGKWEAIKLDLASA